MGPAQRSSGDWRTSSSENETAGWVKQKESDFVSMWHSKKEERDSHPLDLEQLLWRRRYQRPRRLHLSPFLHLVLLISLAPFLAVRWTQQSKPTVGPRHVADQWPSLVRATRRSKVDLGSKAMRRRRHRGCGRDRCVLVVVHSGCSCRPCKKKEKEERQ
jgi:hypothetical protein